jgi:hypothetical protein
MTSTVRPPSAPGDQLAVSVTAVEIDSIALSYSWSVTPSTFGTFSAQTNATAPWTVAGSGICTVRVDVSAGGFRTRVASMSWSRVEELLVA